MPTPEQNSHNSLDVRYLAQFAAIDQEQELTKKYEVFKERISAFKDISTLQEAKKLAAQILPTAMDVSIFKVGGAKCTVINKSDMFRVSLDSPSEFISYDFI